jgi:hypothetical protein
MPRLGSRRNALAMTVGWWLLRRKLRERAGTAVAGLLAGEGLSLAAPPKRHRLRNLLLLAGAAAVGYVVWKRLQGGSGDDWGTWEPQPPAPAPPPEPAPAAA